MNITERRPTHPGKMLLETELKPLGLTVTESAKRLGISRKNLSDLIHEDISLSLNMAMRIAEATDTTPESWLNMQLRLDVWEAMHRKRPDVKKFTTKIAV
jgi:addiction module HigA family antidote